MSSQTTTLGLQLGEIQLAKLTNDSLEIRIRALEQIETRFMRCLQHRENINFKPVLLLKQIVRWFGLRPLLAADRVLALMLELIRSQYVAVIIQKIPIERLLAELEKIRKIIYSPKAQAALDLVDEIESLAKEKYNRSEGICTANTETTTSPSTTDNTIDTDDAASSSIDLDEYIPFNLTVDKFEPAWNQISIDDQQAIQSMIDTLTQLTTITTTTHDEQNCSKSEEMQIYLTHVKLKMIDYPAEYLLQSPHLFLHLVQLLQVNNSDENIIEYVSRVICSYLEQLQNRIQILRNDLSHTVNLSSNNSTAPTQLRVACALTLLLENCLQLLAPKLIESTSNYHFPLLRLTAETLKTHQLFQTAIPINQLQQFGKLCANLIDYCNQINANNFSTYVAKLAIPRANSVNLNGQLQYAIANNIIYDADDWVNKQTLYKLTNILRNDCIYLYRMPEQREALEQSMMLLGPNSDYVKREQQLNGLLSAYKKAIKYLIGNGSESSTSLLQMQKEICLVITQLQSQKLLQKLMFAITDCIPNYVPQKQRQQQPLSKLRVEAESLICTLIELPCKTQRYQVYQWLLKTIMQNFHAHLNHTRYVSGCSNQTLLNNHILGIPLSTAILRKLLINSQSEEADVQSITNDIIIVLMKIGGPMLKLLVPLLPLLIWCSINQPLLHKQLWQLLDPDSMNFELIHMLRGNICYLFHPESEVRKEATVRVAYLTLHSQDEKNFSNNIGNLVLDVVGEDLCVIKPPIHYQCIFTNTQQQKPSQELEHGVNKLVKLLNICNLRPTTRKSTFLQLNELLSNWETAKNFCSNETFTLVLESLNNSQSLESASDTVIPIISIVLKMMLISEQFLNEMRYSLEIYSCLIHSLLLLPHELQLRQEISISLFLLLFGDHHISPTAGNALKFNIDLNEMLVPIIYEVEKSNSATSSVAKEGIELEQQLFATHFNGNVEAGKLYLRLNVAPIASLTYVQALDIADTMKLTPAQLALLSVSNINHMLSEQLCKAKNCSSHDSLHEIISRIRILISTQIGRIGTNNALALWQLIHKYVRLVPGNSADRQLHKALLELLTHCLYIDEIETGLNEALESDSHHSFFLMIEDRTIPLDVLQLICDCLEQVVRIGGTATKSVNWIPQLFKTLLKTIRINFELRQLERVRCMLIVIRSLTTLNICSTPNEIKNYCQYFLQLSKDLPTTTHTGSQWQRDCLRIICQLSETESELKDNNANNETTISSMPFPPNSLGYILNLCGHNDNEVRALAWVCLAKWIKINTNYVEKTLNQLNYLPGGLPACCLTTLLDESEDVLVRQLSGEVFVLLIPTVGAKSTIDLLQYHKFFNYALAALNTDIIYSDIVSAYITICLGLLRLESEWCETLCSHPFANALSDVLKMSPPTSYLRGIAHNDLCLKICTLYAMCYKTNFAFLQRFVCRDPVLMECVVELTQNVIYSPWNPQDIIALLMSLLVFCKDANAYRYLFEQFSMKPKILLQLFIPRLDPQIIITELVRTTLSSLTVLLVKSQNSSKDDFNLIKVMELYKLNDDINDNTKEKRGDEDDGDGDGNGNEHDSNEKKEMEKNIDNVIMNLTFPKGNWKTSPLGRDGVDGACLLAIALIRLFQMNFPIKKYSFKVQPTTTQQQICETLAILLKVSPSAIQAAQSLMLLDHILQLIENFLGDDSIGNATTYVKTMGAHKTRDIIFNLIMLFSVLLSWHSSKNSAITEPLVAVRIVCLLLRIWPWLSHSMQLKENILRLIVHLTQNSFEMCRQVSIIVYNNLHSLLQMMVRVADYETTTKKEAPSSVNNSIIIEDVLRVMAQCCRSTEGRISLNNMHILDMFDTIFPGCGNTTMAMKVKPKVLLAWLNFWEIFSRHSQGAKACHVPALLNAINRSPPLSAKRIKCLQIIRNMCFYTVNRLTLIDKYDVINLLVTIIEQQPVDATNSWEEQYLALLSLWKLAGFSVKHRALLRGSRITEALATLSDNVRKLDQLPYSGNICKILLRLYLTINQS